MRFRRDVTFVLSSVFLAFTLPVALAVQPTGPAELSIIAPVTSCTALAKADISQAVGAPTQITSALEAPDGKPAPYCDVKGFVEPQIRFEVRLPLTTWTQRFVQTGCGGLCGDLKIHLGNDEGCMPSTHGELALASSDMGHSGGRDGQFGAKDYQLRIDFAYRGVHVTALAAKTLIMQFYGQGPLYSYFSGCSDGGREALMEAQRFPGDFNGITAGAPAMNFTTQNTFFHGWNSRVNVDDSGRPILTADKLPILHKAAVAECDALDGLVDGLIGNPLACHFDPARVECKPRQNAAACLTAAQVKVARDLYSGAHDSEGNKLVLSGPLPGSELAWAGVYIPQPGQDRVMSTMISTGTLKYLAYQKNPPDSYALKDLRFDRATFAETTTLHGLYDATDPDLSAFATNGGKLILWHGLADPHISPLSTIAYYTAMENIMGKTAVNQFARLYLFPGGDHCGGGEGPFNVDLLTPIVAWVERSNAPGALIATHRAGPGSEGPPARVPPEARMPLGPPEEHDRMPRPRAIGPPRDMSASGSATQDRTRPVFPYPITAKYSGAGNIDDFRSFVAGPPEPVSPVLLNWLGSSFYSPHYEVWCTAQLTTMKCSSAP